MIRIIYLFLFCTTIVAQSNFDQSVLKDRIDKLLKDLPRGSKTSAIIYDPLTKDTMYSYNILDPKTPASNVKLYTTAAALNLLGPEFLLSTQIFTDDINLLDSVINGNLVIKGFGNSIFADSTLDSLVNEIKLLGIKHIEGNIIGDDSNFDTYYRRDDWIVGEAANVPLPPISALVVNRNQFKLIVDCSGKIGTKPTLTSNPNGTFIEFKNETIISDKNDIKITNSSAADTSIIVSVKGKIKKSNTPKSYTVFAENPPLYAALLLKSKLETTGIKVDGKAKINQKLIQYYPLFSSSIKLKDLIKPINKNSDNFLAECLFKELGAFYSGSIGNSFYATQAVLNFCEENDIDTELISIVDGSGISRFNKLTIKSLVSLLEKIYFNDELFPYFLSSLAVSGVDGTLEDRMIETAAEFNFRGKTGTLNGVSSIAGFLSTKSNNDLIVVFLMEFNRKGANYYRNIQDKIIGLCAEML
ncbi:MAG: D-alanyl-D-alanine carboxypeptidase/D-alanyl-D-alanine-endopeptidase [Melioribacteraceae bacterium]|nr:D-alanyl-D-alanine carboxypeptidase/D-alanyl-D-alanine-endopeptidase [Melioribacteraceae bacterium]